MKSLKATLKLGSSSNRYAPRLPQQETKSSTKQLAPTDPILGPEKLLKTGFAQKGLPSTSVVRSGWFAGVFLFSVTVSCPFPSRFFGQSLSCATGEHCWTMLTSEEM